MDRLQVALLAGLLCLAPLQAKEITTTSVPAVVKQLRQQYKLPEPARTGAKDLGGLVALQQRYYPQAWVSSGFYDWRTTSQYRSHAGLHLGYDIAMPAGTSVAAGWSGTVTGVAPWTGTEWGVTVESADGTRTTYGHISPSVNVGAHVQAGDVVGRVVHDHVDVKMRDAAGNYLDFGGNGKVPGPSWEPVAGSREDYLVAWLVAQNAYDLAKEDQQRGLAEVRSAKLERQRLKARLPVLQENVKTMEDYVAQGLVARVSIEQARQELTEAQERAKKLNADAARQDRVAGNLAAQLSGASKRLETAKAQARQRGLTWSEVQAFVNAKVAEDPKLAKTVTTYKSATATELAKKKADLERRLKDSEKSLASLEELFTMGGLPKADLEAAREKHKILAQQLRALR